MLRNRELFTDFAVVSFFLAIAYGTSMLFSLDIIVSVLLYLALPAAYLCYRRKKNYRKIFLASSILGLLGGMAYDLAAEFNNVYIVHYSYDFLNYHILGKTPIGDFLWALLIPFATIVHYEHFIDSERVQKISKRFPIAVIIGSFLLILVVSSIILFPDTPPLPYAYFMVGFLSILPLIGLYFEKRLLVLKMFFGSAYFFILNLVFEVSALSLSQWSFPGQYLGWLHFAGVSLPVEELFLWIVPSSLVIILCYEVLFDDNN